jgi:hypothetical protein
LACGQRLASISPNLDMPDQGLVHFNNVKPRHLGVGPPCGGAPVFPPWGQRRDLQPAKFHTDALSERRLRSLILRH